MPNSGSATWWRSATSGPSSRTAFAIGILVDVANHALSPAVNDPTTAVQVLDYLGETLRRVGTTELRVQTLGDGDRPSRGVVIPARSWQDYLSLTAEEIRENGDGGIQIMRRLRAMLEELHEEVRPEYRAAVSDELVRLDATVQRAQSIEPTFGQIKHNRGFRQFRRRGRAAARSEWRLITATHNLLKLHQHWTAPTTA